MVVSLRAVTVRQVGEMLLRPLHQAAKTRTMGLVGQEDLNTDRSYDIRKK